MKIELTASKIYDNIVKAWAEAKARDGMPNVISWDYPLHVIECYLFALEDDLDDAAVRLVYDDLCTLRDIADEHLEDPLWWTLF